MMPLKVKNLRAHKPLKLRFIFPILIAIRDKYENKTQWNTKYISIRESRL